MADLTLEQPLSAEPERVWQAWTDPEQLTRWLWPARFDTTVTIEAVVGGHYRVRSEPMSMGVSGEYLRFDEPSTLEFTWRWDGEIEQTKVVVTVAPSAARSTLTLQHSGFRSDPVRDDHVQGWRDCLGRLADFVGPAAEAESAG